MKNLLFYLLLPLILLSSCIKDDFIQDTIDPVLRISDAIDTIELNTTYQLDAIYLNNIGVEEMVPFTWTSSQPAIISINNDGLAEALQLGSSIISVEYNDGQTTLNDAIEIHVGDKTVSISEDRTGTIETTSSYTLTGDFVLKENGDDLILEFADNYKASSSLPGLYLYLTNNNNSIANALEIGKVTTFSGAHAYDISSIGLHDYNYLLYYCKPFNVKVGDGEISN